jgi:hypothetical protein
LFFGQAAWNLRWASREGEQWQQHANGTPPAPSLTSTCSWGGSQVEWQKTARSSVWKSGP